jgi:hypothetical protein
LVAQPIIVLRQAQHEDAAFMASPSKINLILSLSKDEAASMAAAANRSSSQRRQRRPISSQAPGFSTDEAAADDPRDALTASRSATMRSTSRRRAEAWR